MKIHDGIVIGGGVAGSALAIQMARAGRDMLLLEKEAGPHHKVCGEFLGARAAALLRGLGLEVEDLGARAIDAVRLIDGDKSVTRALPVPGWSLSRYVLDEALLRLAAEAGAAVRRGQVVRDFARRDGFYEVDISRQARAYGQNIFLATGKHDLRRWKRQGAEDKAGLIGFKMHYRLNVAQNEALAGHTEMILLRGGYAGLQPVEGGRANLCFLVDKEIYAQCGKDWRRLVAWLMQGAPHLARRLDGARALWDRPVTIYRIPYGYVDAQPGQAGLFRLGDQKAVIHSFAGDGMAMALQSAVMAAGAALGHEGQEAYDYNAAMRARAAPPVRQAQILARMAFNPYLRTAFLPVVRRFPGLIDRMYHATRV